MQFTKQAALDLARLCEQAYTVAHEGSPDPSIIPIRMPLANRPALLKYDPLDIWGFVAVRDNRPYIVFRGTQITEAEGIKSLQEWAEDLYALPQVAFGTGKVHYGFLAAWIALKGATLDAIEKAAWPSAWSTLKPIITGHSLGAAIATLCWADIGGDLMTFASPRVGSPKFSDSLWSGETVRVVNKPDILPDVPLDTGGPASLFRHGGEEIKVDGPGFLQPQVAHSLESYIAGIEKLDGHLS